MSNAPEGLQQILQRAGDGGKLMPAALLNAEPDADPRLVRCGE